MIESLNDLKKLLQLCRKQGVQEIELGSVKIKLGDMPTEGKVVQESEMTEANDPYSNFPDGILSPSQLAFYSSGGVPDEDPELEEHQ